MQSRVLPWHVGAALACALVVWPARAQASPLRVALAPQLYCDPRQPVPSISGAAPDLEVRFVRERSTPEGWQTDFEGVIGFADAEGHLSARVPARAGVYRSYAVSAKHVSNAVYFASIGECMPPIRCDGAAPCRALRLTVPLSQPRPGEPVTILVEQATPDGRLLLVRERFNGRDWETVLKRELGQADGEGRLLDVERAFEPGLYRDTVHDLESGTPSEGALYEVRPRP